MGLREAPAQFDMAGYFVNTVILRPRLSPSMPVVEAVRKVGTLV